VVTKKCTLKTQVKEMRTVRIREDVREEVEKTDDERDLQCHHLCTEVPKIGMVGEIGEITMRRVDILPIIDLDPPIILGNDFHFVTLFASILLTISIF